MELKRRETPRICCGLGDWGCPSDSKRQNNEKQKVEALKKNKIKVLENDALKMKERKKIRWRVVIVGNGNRSSPPCVKSLFFFFICQELCYLHHSFFLCFLFLWFNFFLLKEIRFIEKR